MSAAITADKPRVRVRAGETALSTAAFQHLTGGSPVVAAGLAAAAGLPAIAAQVAAAVVPPAPVIEAPAAAAEAAPGQEPAAEPARHDNGKFKSKKDEDEDDDEEGDHASDDDENTGKRGKEKASARSRERARCAAIFRCEHAAANTAMAAHLAFETNLNRTAAVALLAAVPAPASGLAQAMTGYPNAPVGAGASKSPAPEQVEAKKVDAGFDRAMQQHMPKAANLRRRGVAGK
ncbi:MAG: hypothetical protein ACRYGR_00675 [Janthinobacterium lividum]